MNESEEEYVPTKEELESYRIDDLIRRTPAHMLICNLVNAARDSGYANASNRLQPNGTVNPVTGEYEPADSSWKMKSDKEVARLRGELKRTILELSGKWPEKKKVP